MYRAVCVGKFMRSTVASLESITFPYQLSENAPTHIAIFMIQIAWYVQHAAEPKIGVRSAFNALTRLLTGKPTAFKTRLRWMGANFEQR